jgi:uncharacterized membrane protein
MKSRASVARHPLHPILVPLPIGLWIFSFLCDVAALVTGGSSWEAVASIAIAGGIVTGLAAALPGLIDLATLPPSRARRIGLWHMMLNLGVLLLFILDFLWRRHASSGSPGPFLLSLAAIALLSGSGWLGGEMVYVHGVAVDPSGERDLR